MNNSELKNKFNLFTFNIVIIPLIGILFLILLIFILSDTPLDALYFFFLGPFRNVISFGNMLNAAVPFILGALGIIIAVKSGSLNLGGEGQVYLGAFIACITALSGSLGIFSAVIALLAGSLCSGAAAAISGLCKAKWNTSELITTFLISCAVIPIINFLVTGPFLDPETSLISTRKISENMRFSLILKPSNLNTSVFLAVFFVFLVNIFLYKTKLGYEFRIAGNNELFASYGGINTKLNTITAMAMSGALYGFAGGIAVLGTHYAVIKDFSSGLGWSGLTVALIAGFSPAAVIPCAVFLAWVNSGARIAMQNTGLTYEVAHIVQAFIFLLSTSIAVKNFLNKRKKTNG